MPLHFARSAARHRISEVRARHVVDQCACPLYSEEPGEEDLVIFLGPDDHGVPLEVIGIQLAEEDILVVHAMRLRPKYVQAYGEVMRWRGR